MKLKRFPLLCVSLLFLLLLPFSVSAQPPQPQSQPLPEATWDKLPQWRGFNLLEKFFVTKNRPFVEEDFRMIRDLGFNFVRLPMDYRCWIVDGDWEKFDEKTLSEIDQAVEWGGKYGIHVMLNFHRAPGFTVAKPKEATSLWTDQKTQEVCCKHWALFAERYKGISNNRLSFNLVNEPGGISEEVYLEVAKKMIDAIHAIDPNRLIVSDGLDWGPQAFKGAKSLKMALAGRGYVPWELTHYKANWSPGADDFPLPTWPLGLRSGLLFGASKKSQQVPIVIEGPFVTDTELSWHLVNVSAKAEFYVKADGKPIFEQKLQANDGEGEWNQQQKHGLYDKDYRVTIPQGTKSIEMGLGKGDWLILSKLTLGADAKETSINLRAWWNSNPESAPSWRYDATSGKLHSTTVIDRASLVKTMIEPWLEVEKDGVGVMVGEFGCYNKTSHDVMLPWMEDCLKNWHEAGWGWALWNFRGPFGILDSGRADVQYEDFQGHKLDRKLLDLLKKY